VIKEFPELKTLASDVAISPDGKVAASAGREGKVHVLDLEAGKLKYSIPEAQESGAESVTISSTGVLVGAGGNPEHRTMYLWDLATGQELERHVGEEWRCWFLSFCGDGKTLMSVGFGQSNGSALCVWQITTKP
jgi:WD40 repeat protein